MRPESRLLKRIDVKISINPSPLQVCWIIESKFQLHYRIIIAICFSLDENSIYLGSCAPEFNKCTTRETTEGK